MTQEDAVATKKDLQALATKEELHELARMTAEGFAEVTANMATKVELRKLETKMEAGFSLIMENLTPLRRDYEALKDDLVPQVAELNVRLTKVEQKVAKL